ncbi:16S rRNA (cytosine(1402)-N(4))-methyltransferase RsmH [bacterium]|nr:16S rRNA (cytosine(1402)-N(4))-methyltransferase RsmH [bacterium]
MTPDATPSIHIPVLMREVLRGLELSAGLTVVDGTFGGGGHARKILEAIGPTGRLIGLDRDLDAIQRAHASPLPENLTVKQASYSELPAILTALQIESVDRILVDLGFSSDQLGTLSRGFGFLSESLLDLRFDYTQGVPAWQLLQSAPEPELRSIFDEFGEEPAARKLAAAIVAQRSQMQMISAKRFAEFVAATIGTSGSRERHPATRAFQALRIAVNRELEHLKTALEQSFPQALKAGGILAVITFHSLEDRLVKDAFKESDVWENLTPKPIGPTPAEERFNPRSRSAKLRLARRKP